MGCKFIADDYGITNEINQAILELCRRKIISKVSVMPGHCLIGLDKQQAEKVLTGLHVNLTTNAGYEAQDNNKTSSPVGLFYRCYIKRDVNVDLFIEIIRQQVELVESKGIRISYLDTHKHVHIIPKVLMALIIVAKEKRINFVRCITMRKRYFPFYFYALIRYGFIRQVPKMFILYFWGSIMKRILDKHHIEYSKNLVLMPLAMRGDYSSLMKDLYHKLIDEDAEIVTHPGLTKDIGFDDYIAGRIIEFETLIELSKRPR
jgi:predicted glycoside hydrolase/deacetylase ChbG (UPF0249 family)